MEELQYYRKTKFIQDFQLFFEDQKLIDLHEDDPEQVFIQFALTLINKQSTQFEINEQELITRSEQICEKLNQILKNLQSQQNIEIEKEVNKQNQPKQEIQKQIQLQFQHENLAHCIEKNEDIVETKEIRNVFFLNDDITFVTIGEDQQCHIWEIQQDNNFKKLHSLKLYIYPNSFVCFMRNKNLLCYTGNESKKNKRQMNFLKLSKKGFFMQQVIKQGQGIYYPITGICHHNPSNNLFTLQKKDNKNGMIVYHNFSTKKVLTLINFQKNFDTIDCYDQVPYLFFTHNQSNSLSIFHIFKKQWLLKDFKVEKGEQFRLYSIFPFQDSNQNNLIAMSFIINLDNQQAQGNCYKKGCYEYKVSIFQLEKPKQQQNLQINKIASQEWENHVIGFFYIPKIQKLLYVQGFDQKVYRAYNLSNILIEQQMKKSQIFQEYKIGYIDINKTPLQQNLKITSQNKEIQQQNQNITQKIENILQNTIIYSQQCAQINCLSLDFQINYMLIGQDNGNLRLLKINQN